MVAPAFSQIPMTSLLVDQSGHSGVLYSASLFIIVVLIAKDVLRWLKKKGVADDHEQMSSSWKWEFVTVVIENL